MQSRVVFCFYFVNVCNMCELVPHLTRPKTSSSLASFKSRLFLPFWYWHTQVVLKRRLLNGSNSSISCISFNVTVIEWQHISALSLSLILCQRLKAFLFLAFFPDIVIDNPSLLAHHLWILKWFYYLDHSGNWWLIDWSHLLITGFAGFDGSISEYGQVQESGQSWERSTTAGQCALTCLFHVVW